MKQKKDYCKRNPYITSRAEVFCKIGVYKSLAKFLRKRAARDSPILLNRDFIYYT